MWCIPCINPELQEKHISYIYAAVIGIYLINMILYAIVQLLSKFPVISSNKLKHFVHMLILPSCDELWDCSPNSNTHITYL